MISFRYLRCRSRFFVLSVFSVVVYLIVSIITSNGRSHINDNSLTNDYSAQFDSKLKRHNKVLDNKDRKSHYIEGIGEKYTSFRQKCKEKTNIAFIKCMKCATETMGTIIRRFGYTRKLSFLTPRTNKLYLGWPYLMTDVDYRPSSRGFNIIMEHSVYNRTIMEKLLPKDTLFVSIIREPFSHVKSTINYFKILQIARVPGSNPFSEYLHNLEKYEAVYKSPASARTRYCIPDNFSLTRNLQSHCLGMPVGFPAGRKDISHNPQAVRDYIHQLGKDFSLMMLVEHFDESLILLKRKMCWTFKDIIYKSTNRGNYSYKNNPDEDLLAAHKRWSPADYQLYDYFNKTFWQLVREQGSDFHAEVAEYRQVLTQTGEFCSKGGNSHVTGSAWSPGFTLDQEFCNVLNASLLGQIQQQHDEEEMDLLIQRAEFYINHKPQALC